MATKRRRSVTVTADEMTEYLVELSSGKKFKVAVHKNWRITFGPWAPPAGRGRGGFQEPGQSAGTLRIYEGTTIRGCFSPVVAFHDTTLAIHHMVRMEKGDMKWEEDDRGNVERHVKVLAETSWDKDPLRGDD